jgi:hypothetical protein
MTKSVSLEIRAGSHLGASLRTGSILGILSGVQRPDGPALAPRPRPLLRRMLWLASESVSDSLRFLNNGL